MYTMYLKSQNQILLSKCPLMIVFLSYRANMKNQPGHSSQQIRTWLPQMALKLTTTKQHNRLGSNIKSYKP